MHLVINDCASFHLYSVYNRNYDDKIILKSQIPVWYSFQRCLMLRIYSTNSATTSSSSTSLNTDPLSKKHLKYRDLVSNRHYHMPLCNHRLENNLLDTSFILDSSENEKNNYKVQNNSSLTRKMRPHSNRFDPRSVVLEWCRIRTLNYSVK